MSGPLSTSITRVCPICESSYPYQEEHPCLSGHRPASKPAVVEAIQDDLIGTTLGERYQIEACLRGGGMGMVYRARHVILGRPLAVKVLRVAADEAAQKRFLQEARLASELAHENIVDISDFGVLSDGRPYLVMELLRGETLGEPIARGPLPPMRACLIAAQIARGLQAVHRSGIIHRDLKPDNIFLLSREGQQDFVKIVDFGVAKDFRGPALTVSGVVPVAEPVAGLTEVGMVVGTAEYMAPEQAMGKELDHRVDQYALGCILYEMLTGALPFSGLPRELLEKHAFEVPIPPRERRPDLGLPPSLEALVLRAMAKSRGERFSTLREMEQALRQEAAALGAQGERLTLSAPATNAAPTAPRKAVRSPGHKWRLPGMVGVIAGLVGAGVYLLVETFLPRHASHHGLTLAPAQPPALPAFVSPAPPAPAPLVPPAPPEVRHERTRPARKAAVTPPPPEKAPEKSKDEPLFVHFEVHNRDVSVTVTCTDRPLATCTSSCTVEIGQGPGECVARAPSSGYRPQRFPFAQLRSRPRDGQGRASQMINLDFIAP